MPRVEYTIPSTYEADGVIIKGGSNELPNNAATRAFLKHPSTVLRINAGVIIVGKSAHEETEEVEETSEATTEGSGDGSEETTKDDTDTTKDETSEATSTPRQTRQSRRG